MKIFVCAGAILLALTSCGTTDNKNEVENYPTYDTTETTDHINDSSGRTQSSEGNLRHNTDHEESGQ
jgi:hypothetical protein